MIIIKIDIGALFIFIGGDLWILVSLEPGEVLGVITPRLLLQLSRRQVLLVCALLEIEDEEQCVRVVLLEETRVFEDW